jgi:thiamine biosynthesis lipoprotein
MRSSAALLFFLAIACETERPQGELIEAEAAGAAFRVRLAERLPENERADVEKIVGDSLARVRSMVSSSLAESDLSRLLRAAAGVETPVSVETFEMTREAVRVSDLTGGAFVPAPLARLWGFGPGSSAARVRRPRNR